MAKRIIYLAELQPYDPVGSVTRIVNFSDNLIDAAELATSVPYHVRMHLSFSSELSVFEENIPGASSVAIGTIVINNQDGAFDFLMDYVWDTRAVTIKKGYEGDAYAAYTTVFKGATLEITNDGTNLTIIMRDTSYKLIEPLQDNKYSGGGNEEGGSDLANRRKPLCYGKVRNLTPIWVDTALLTMQVHDGAVEAITAVYDKANKLTFSADYASYAALIAANINSGYYATCLAQGFIRLGAKAAGNITCDVNGQYYTAAATLAALASTVLQNKGGIPSGDIDSASVTTLASDHPYAYEGIYMSEPDVSIGEFLDNVINAQNAFWYVAVDGKITFKQFKFRTPTRTVEEQNIATMSRESSPAPLYRVVTQYARNATVQSPDEFAIPRETLNGYLKDERVYIPTASDGSGGTYTYTGQLYAFLNDQQVNGFDNVQFREVTPVSWLTLAQDGTFTISNPGTNSVSVDIEARIGEVSVTETFYLTKRLSPATSTLVLTPSVRRFKFNDDGSQVTAGQTSVITATGTGLGTTTWSAVDNLGNTVALTGSGSSRTLAASSVSGSPIVEWVRVSVQDTTNGTSNSTKIVIQRGENAVAVALLDAMAAANEAVTIYYQNSAPSVPPAETGDLWYDLDDNNKVYTYNGSVWTLVADTRIADALTQAAGAQATADGKITTFFTESTPTATAVGDLWYKPSTKKMFRWNGTNWSSEVGTWGADWATSLTGIPANLGALTGTEVINNQILLNAIASDDVISASEKIHYLLPTEADLEGRYTEIMSKASSLSLSTANLTTARTNWKSLLSNWSPAWNDTTQDSTIFVSFFGDKNFPAGWTTSSVSTAASGIYTTVTDTSGSVLGSIKRSQAIASAYFFSAGIIVKKDATPKTTRWCMLKLYGSTNFFTINFATDTGEFVLTNSPSSGGVLDLGSEWFVYVSGGLTSGVDTIAGVEFYPAVGSNSNLTTTNGGVTGSVDVRGPIITTGNRLNLGRYMVGGFLNAYQTEITKFNAQLAAWQGVSSVPANLATLVGTEAINNQLVLNSIANDQILSVQEKFDLIKLVGDLESRYTDLFNRATTVGVSTTNMAAARANFRGLIAFYSPVYNDLSQDTSIYTPLFGDKNFPTGWTLNSVSTTANGVYTTVTDSTTGAFGEALRQTTATGSTTYSVGYVIKKFTSDTHSAALRLSFIGGVTRSCLVWFNPYTGAYTLDPANTLTPDAVYVYDLGSGDWIVAIQGTSGADNTTVRAGVLPAYSNSAQSGTFVSLTGSVDVKGAPLLAIGGVGRLGRDFLVGRLAAFSLEMTKVAQLISGYDGSTTDWVDGPASANVNYNNAGTTISDSVDLNYTLKAGSGVTQTSGVTATYKVVEGTVNGFTASSSAQTISVSSGVATLTINSLTTATATITISMVRNGLTKTLKTVLTKVLAPPSGTGGGGSGGGATTSDSQTSGFTTITAASPTFQQVSAMLTTGSVPAGKTTCTVAVSLTPKMGKTQSTTYGNYGPWNVQVKLQRNVSGTRSAIGSLASGDDDSNPDPYNDDSSEGYVTASGGQITATFTFAVSSGTTYNIEVWGTITSGTFNSAVGMAFPLGSVSLTLS